MLKEIPERITYAQEKLIKLIEERKLRKWCLENGLSHSTIYKLATGEKLPSYPIVCSMSHLVPPIEWLFYTDEQIPYEAQTVLPLEPGKECRYVAAHRKDYREMAEKYGLTEIQAYNIVIGRKKPNLGFIRQTCGEVNPIEFFIPSDEAETKITVPERGDIASINGKNFLVLSEKESNETNGTFVACPLTSEENGIPLVCGCNVSGKIKACGITSFPVETNTLVLGKAAAETVETVTKEIINLVSKK